MAIAISARRPQTRLGRKPDGISSHLQREPKHGSILLHHYLVSVTFLRRITLSPFYQTWADIKREALQSITLSTTAPDDSILPKIDDLIATLLDQGAKMQRAEKMLGICLICSSRDGAHVMVLT
jgi:hypothetical protein